MPTFPTPIQLYIFDLDGTLVNSEMAIVNAFQHALQECNLPPIDEAWFSSQIGAPFFEILDEHLAHHTTPTYSQSTFLKTFRERFMQLAAEHSTLLPEVHTTLQQLKNRGARLAVATNKPVAQAHHVLEGVGIDVLFDHVVGIVNEDPAVMKPHPEMINRVLSHFAISANAAVMIGDTWRDIAAGKAAGTFTVGITTGSDSAERLQQEQPDAVIHQLSALL